MEKITVVKKEKKMTDSELNIWVKKLPIPFKTIFYKNLFANKLIWAPGMDLVEKQKRFNNYRYKGIAVPNHPTQILIYLTALTVNAELKITTLFPNIDQEWIAHLLPILVESSLKTNHFSYVENQKEQLN